MTEQRKSRKERRTARQMHADLVQLGFDGSYERAAAFVRAWKGDRQRAQRTKDRGTFVPPVFQPGEAFLFDWSEDWGYVSSERIKLQVAHIKLSHSRAFLVRAYLLQAHEILFDAHRHGFRVFEGIPPLAVCVQTARGQRAETAHGRIANISEAEKPSLMPQPTALDGFVERRARVSPTRCLAAHACMRDRGPDHLRSQSRLCSRQLCEPTCEPSYLPRTAGHRAGSTPLA